MYLTFKDPTVEYEGLKPESILNSWIDSRSKFLRWKDSSHTKVENFVTGEIFDADKYLEEVMEMDLAFNYFQVGIFKFKTSVLIRDFFYTFQEYKGKWATTQRYSTQKDFILSAELDQGDYTKEALRLFVEATEKYNKGELTQFDDVRELMPLAYQVSWQASMPIKQFIKIMACLLNLVGETSMIWRLMWSACYKDENLRPWLSRILKYRTCDENYKYSIYHLDEVYPKETVNKLYKNIGKVGCVLYSQLIRHEDTYVAGYFEFIKKVNTLKVGIPNCKLEFPIRLMQSKKRELEMLRVRTSWWAVTDNWTSNNTWACILRHFIPEGAKLEDYKKYFIFFDKDGKYDESQIDRHKVDDSLRLHKGYNAYFPNAFQLESRQIVVDRIKRYGNNPLLQLYLQVFDLGYVKDNPKNPDRIKWESLQEKK